MNNIEINSDLLKKINSFLKKDSSLHFLNPYLFETIDKNKEVLHMNFNNYYMDYIVNLPKLDYETAVKISRKVYELYGKEQEFDKILERLVSNNSFVNGSVNPNDDNYIPKTTESKILLSGTYYDVVLICHEIGHKLRYDDSMEIDDIMDSFLYEVPSIIMELAANDYLKENYGVDLNADQLRKLHVLTIKRDKNIENDIFLVVLKLLKEKKLNIINLYREFNKVPAINDYLSNQSTSIESCIDEGISAYSYDVGYILGNYAYNGDNKKKNLDMILKCKDKGIDFPFTIEEDIIKKSLESQQFGKLHSSIISS